MQKPKPVRTEQPWLEGTIQHFVAYEALLLIESQSVGVVNMSSKLLPRRSCRLSFVIHGCVGKVKIRAPFRQASWIVVLCHCNECRKMRNAVALGTQSNRSQENYRFPGLHGLRSHLRTHRVGSSTVMVRHAGLEMRGASYVRRG